MTHDEANELQLKFEKLLTSRKELVGSLQNSDVEKMLAIFEETTPRHPSMLKNGESFDSYVEAKITLKALRNEAKSRGLI